MIRKLLILILVGCASFNASSQGFLKRDNMRIVDGNGENFILRGIGLGGYMLQEGYMLKTGDFAGPQHAIKAKIESVIGKENTDTFYQTWIKNYMQKVDVDSLKAYGFNSIRLPMHYNLFTLPVEDEKVAGENTWLDKGFLLVDTLLKWCEANQIYLILDMHATPGGQGKDAAISDYDAAKPSLWESDANKNKLIALWKKLAERYANEPYIGAYDLINEINWDFENSNNQNGCNCTQNKPLWDLFKKLIAAVREVDTNHIIILEGNCWGNNYGGLGTLPSVDNNLALSFHKYWNYNDQGSIQGLLNLRNTTKLPLWCGESGENSNVWYTQAISLLENNNIGWAWWTYKKLESTSGTNSVSSTPDYEKLLKYWKSGGTKPTVESAKATMMKLADNLKIENCKINHDVFDAQIRQVKSSDSKPFVLQHLPGSIYASNYDLGRTGVAYFDIDSADYHVSTNNYTSWNSGYAYRNDGVDIQTCTDSASNGFNVGWTNTGEWMQYTVYVDSSMGYKVSFRYASDNATCNVHLSADGKNITGNIAVPRTGGWASWKTLTLDNIVLTKGWHKLKLHFDQNGCNVSFMKFEYSKTIAQVPFDKTSAYSSEDGKKVYVEVNSVIKSETINPAEFSILVNTIENAITSASKVSDFVMEFNLKDSVVSGQTITISYNGSSIVDTADKALATFSNFQVTNNRPLATKIPAKIEAENYYKQQGLTLEDCKDTGGGKNIAYTNAGDYLDYNILNEQAQTYKVDFRVAATANSGIIELQLVDGEKKTVLGTLNVPSTGDWQKYTTISSNVDLPKGQYILRVFIKNPEFNINWFSFSFPNKIAELNADNELEVYPNPAKDRIVVKLKEENIQGKLMVYNLDGRILFSQAVNTNTEVDVQTLKNGVYLLKFAWENKESLSNLVINK